MNNKDFISALAQAMGTTATEAARTVDDHCHSIISTLMKGEAVTIPDFGTFEVKKKMERIIINPSTKSRMLVPPKLVLAFRYSPKLKEHLNTTTSTQSVGADFMSPASPRSTIFAVIEQALLSDRIVKVKGLGIFKVIDVEARQSISVNTGERVTIDSYRKVTFTPDATMRELINEPFAIFDTIILDDATATITTTPTENPDTTEPTNEGEVEGQFVAPETEPEEQEEQEEQEEEEEESHTLRNWALVGAALVLVFIALHLSYRFGYVSDLSFENLKQLIAPDTTASNGRDATPPLLSDTTNAPQPVEADLMPPAQPDSIAASDTTSPLPVDYAAMDSRVRTGAYVITGTDREVVVRKGETLERISRRYLGPGMECYVEVYNGVPRGGTIAPGDTIRIPALKHK